MAGSRYRLLQQRPGVGRVGANRYLRPDQRLQVRVGAAGGDSLTAGRVGERRCHGHLRLPGCVGGQATDDLLGLGRVGASRGQGYLPQGLKPGRLEALGEVALAAARTNPVQAEQVIGSLPPNAPKRAEEAMVAALTDPACAERIAASSADRYLQALVRAVVAVRTDPANAGPLLEQAVEAAGNDPPYVAEIAVVMASTDPARAEQVASTIKAGAGMTAGYWRARALAGLANVCSANGAR